MTRTHARTHTHTHTRTHILHIYRHRYEVIDAPEHHNLYLVLEYLENPIEDIVPCIAEADDGGGMGADEIEAYEQRLRVVVKDLIRGMYCILILEYTNTF